MARPSARARLRLLPSSPPLAAPEAVFPEGSTVQAGDLYLAHGKPLLVMSWRRKNGERVPEECIELDPAKLQRASSNGTIYRYEGQLRR